MLKITLQGLRLWLPKKYLDLMDGGTPPRRGEPLFIVDPANEDVS